MPYSEAGVTDGGYWVIDLTFHRGQQIRSHIRMISKFGQLGIALKIYKGRDFGIDGPIFLTDLTRRGSFLTPLSIWRRKSSYSIDRLSSATPPSYNFPCCVTLQKSERSFSAM